MIRHTNKEDLPFACTICNHKMASKIELETHTNLHTHDNQFMCNECGHTFLRKTLLHEHIKYTHQRGPR